MILKGDKVGKINEALEDLKKNGKEGTILFRLLSKQAEIKDPDEKDVEVLLETYKRWSKNWS